MRSFVPTRFLIAACAAVLCAAPVASAGVFRDIVFGLGYAGFNVQGERNVLSGGGDFSIGRNFIGNALDFGAADLTLQGPISLEFSTGGRELSTLDIRLQTATNSDLTSQPLAYALNYDVGGQLAEVTGTVLIDAEFSLNGFGFYDLELDYSSRQSIGREGRFSNGVDEQDFDVGPIRIRGNLFADALAFLTVPLFGADNPNNPFDSFSGRTQLQKAIDRAQQRALDAIANGQHTAEVYLVDASAPPASTGTGNPSIIGDAVDAGGVTSVVPEPTVLLLMLAGVPAILYRTRHRRHRAV